MQVYVFYNIYLALIVLCLNLNITIHSLLDQIQCLNYYSDIYVLFELLVFEGQSNCCIIFFILYISSVTLSVS